MTVNPSSANRTGLVPTSPQCKRKAFGAPDRLPIYWAHPNRDIPGTFSSLHCDDRPAKALLLLRAVVVKDAVPWVQRSRETRRDREYAQHHPRSSCVLRRCPCRMAAIAESGSTASCRGASWHGPIDQFSVDVLRLPLVRSRQIVLDGHERRARHHLQFARSMIVAVAMP